MVRRHNNQLPDNLPQLQNLIKRDPISYKEEFEQQYRYYKNTLDVFFLNPGQFNKSIDELVMFLAQVAQCYPEELSTFPQQLITLLQTHNTVLENGMRMTFCRALILLRNKNLLTPTDLLELFFQLLRCQDKNLRTFLETHIITDIKNLNAKHKNAKLNTTLQNFMYSMLTDSNQRAAKMSADIMIELYKKNVWNDAKTVNVIASGCFSKFTKVMVVCLKFFLSSDPTEKDSDNSDDSDDEPNLKEVMMANKFNKKTKKRSKQLEKFKKLVVKNQKKKSNAPAFNFSAIHLIHDPQGMAEKLLKQLDGKTKRFEVKLMILDVISRLIGLHELFLFNYYPYIQRFMQPHQREVTRILQFAAQASHELVPPDVLEPVLKSLVNNFVTERNSSDVMAIGLNAVREICSRCPLVMNEDLLRDLVEYKNYRDRSVMMAARSLIHLFRQMRPELLHKRDRGRPTEASMNVKSKQYGEIIANDYIPGAEVLLQKETAEVAINSDSGSDDDEWIDVPHSEDKYEAVSNDVEDDNEEAMKVSSDEDNSETDTKTESTNTKAERKILKAKRIGSSVSNEERLKKVELAKKIVLERILTDEDFQRMEIANAKKQVTSARKGEKRQLEEDFKIKQSDLVRLGDIENIYKKRKHDKQTRMESIKQGQENREKYGYKDGRLNIHCSKTHKEKKKTKNFLMMRHKAQKKTKRSFKDKQIALRNHLLKLKKMK